MHRAAKRDFATTHGVCSTDDLQVRCCDTNGHLPRQPPEQIRIRPRASPQTMRVRRGHEEDVFDFLEDIKKLSSPHTQHLRFSCTRPQKTLKSTRYLDIFELKNKNKTRHTLC